MQSLPDEPTASSIIEFIDHTPSTNMKHSFFQKIPIPNTIIPVTPSPVPTTYADDDHVAYLLNK